MIALPDIDPKLIAEMFTRDAGRNAFARPCAAPSTFALGSPTVAAWSWGRESAKVRCLMTGQPSVSSTLLSVPNPT